MIFCTNCGSKINDGSKFCSACGASVVFNKDNGTRKSVYDGEIHKCPNCGEVLNSFNAICPACGYEFRGKAATYSVQQFYQELCTANDIQRKNEMIRNFPIPNTKEDILEFLILASTNIIEVAVFVYKQKDGAMQDYIVRPFDETIKTVNFPVLASIIGLAYDGATPFQAEVYFINLAQIIQVMF